VRPRATSRRALFAVALVGVIGASGCGSSPKAKKLTLLVAGRERIEMAAALGPFSHQTAAVLGNEGLSRHHLAELDEIIAELEERNGWDPTIERTLALSELHYRRGLRSLTLDRESAARSFRDAAAFAYLALADPSVGPRGSDDDWLARDRYNRAVEKLIRLTWWDGALPGHVWSRMLTDAGIDVVGTSSYLDPQRIQDVTVATDYHVMHMQERYASDGLGVPVVAHRVRPGDEEVGQEERLYPRQVWTSATAMAYVNEGLLGNTWRNSPAQLCFHDPHLEEAVPVGERVARLSSDRSTALAVFDSRVNFTRLAKTGLLLAAFQGDGFHQGIVLLQPYQPGKIPVLFIHGLNSSYATWFQNLNHLRNDPELARRYQFWVYLYPTGNPIITSITEARRALRGARDALDPARQDRAWDEMVVVGHSMGGLVTKGLISHSGTMLWDGIFTRPIDEVQAPPEMRQALAGALFFDPVPEIRRAVFIAVPHRGSHIANRVLGQLTSLLIHQPDRLRRLVATLKRRNGPDVLRPEFRNPNFTSVANLRFEDPMLTLFESLPVNGIPYHSIIMKIGTAEHHLDTDGVVPYESAHLPGAESEVIVPGFHTDIGKREVTEELRRILFVHLEELNGNAPGSIPVELPRVRDLMPEHAARR
jgi:pimeloyl-ACP methyl ester carboxylesterase